VSFMEFFSVKTIAFTLRGYSLSWLELIGTFVNLWGVWLMTRNRVLTWPVGIVGVVLFLLLFWQIQLYADCLEQIYYVVTGFWGWYLWKKSGKPDKGLITRNTPRQNAIVVGLVGVFSVLMGWANSHLHLWIPGWFAEAASFAYLDATTTVMSFAAQILMAWRRLECWFIWIAVDVIGIWLYWQKGVVFVAALYVVFLVLATNGLFSWAWQQNTASRSSDEAGCLQEA